MFVFSDLNPICKNTSDIYISLSFVHSLDLSSLCAPLLSIFIFGFLNYLFWIQPIDVKFYIFSIDTLVIIFYIFQPEIQASFLITVNHYSGLCLHICFSYRRGLFCTVEERGSARHVRNLAADKSLTF